MVNGMVSPHSYQSVTDFISSCVIPVSVYLSICERKGVELSRAADKTGPIKVFRISLFLLLQEI